jgi:hypothetical protein
MSNKSLLMLALCVSLTAIPGCGGQEDVSSGSGASSSDDGQEALAAALEKAKKGILIEGNYISVWPSDNSTDTESTFDVTIGPSFYAVNRKTADYYDRENSTSLILEKGEDGYIHEKHLSIMNEEESGLYSNSALGEGSLDYDEYLANPFANLEASDFAYDGTRYSLTVSKLSAFYGFVVFESVQGSTSFDMPVNEVSFALGSNSFNEFVITTGQGEWLGGEKFYFDFTLTVTFLSDPVCPSIEKLAHTDAHDKLETALTALNDQLSGKNYTVHTVDTDSDSGDEWGNYDSYYTDGEIFSDFKPALYNTKTGFKLGLDGKYHKYQYYVSDSTSGDHVAGDTVYVTSDYDDDKVLDRSDLDVNPLGFAPEFFSADSTGLIYTCEDARAVEGIRRCVSAISESRDYSLVATKIVINLADDGTVSSIVCTAYDSGNEYTDDFTYTFTNIGSTTIPVTTADPE